MCCRHCAALLPDDLPVCPRCGRLVEADTRIIRFDFMGNGLEVAGWLLLFLISLPLIIAPAWVLAAACRWFCRRLEFSDGTTAEFVGKGGEILVWIVASLVVMGVAQLALAGLVTGGFWLNIMRELALTVVSAALWFVILGWVVLNLRLSSGERLTFTGEFHGIFGWFLLYQLSLLTIVGWAWVLAAFYRWIARHIKGENIAFDFHGEGHQVLWRTVAMVLMCLPIVTIPWAWLWYKRWIVRSVTATRGAHAEEWAAV
jgi:hypothetical protein